MQGRSPPRTQVNHTGLYAAGFLSYEASPAFDAALSVQPPDPDLPLLWFGLFRQPQVLQDLEQASRELQFPAQGCPFSDSSAPWRPSISLKQFEQAIAQIKQAIAQGNTFQVNYTFRLHRQFRGHPWALFRDLMRLQPGNYAAFVETGRHAICSASPELFFLREGDRLTTRPMKGTAQRGQGCEGDRAQAQALQTSVKNRAENLMIVDMLRNDLGRIAKLGSVQVPRLFDVEQYPTLWQMTSTVTAQSNATMGEVFRALFPCASITGAPKASTMGIIRALECSPRKLYTGAIGYWGLDPQLQIQAQFNVAIRTVLLDLATGQAEYGVGSGIVWDSESSAEYAECVLKTAILN